MREITVGVFSVIRAVSGEVFEEISVVGEILVEDFEMRVVLVKEILVVLVST